MKKTKSPAPAPKKAVKKPTATKLKKQQATSGNASKLASENLQLRAELEHKNRELAIEAAMEKVRARSLAMQKPGELAEVAEVLRKEMGAIGVEELETSSIYIVDENKTTTECWYAIKDVRGKNKKLVTDHMTMDLGETWVGKEMQKFYRSNQTRTSFLMRGENRKEWINYCASKSSVLQGYFGGEIPERTYHLSKFSNGFMGAASPGEISQESWDLLQRATAVFFHLPTSDSAICKKQKPKQEKHRFNWRWKECVPEQWPCRKARSYWPRPSCCSTNSPRSVHRQLPLSLGHL